MAGSKTKCKHNDEGRECTGCGVFKKWENFHRGSGGGHLNGHVSKCKPCLKVERKSTGRTEYKKKEGGQTLDRSLATIFLRWGFHGV